MQHKVADMQFVWVYSLGKMQRLLLWSWLIILAQLLCPATARLSFFEARIVFDAENESPGVEKWEVKGVATVEVSVGENGPAFTFDCNTTENDGTEILWVRDQTDMYIQQSLLSNGMRLEFGRPYYEDLGLYYCVDQATGERVALNITDGNPAVYAVEKTEAVVLGQRAELEVYVAGIQPIQSNWITWFGPDGNELTESDAVFNDSRRRLILHNVQGSSAGVYKCQVSIPNYSISSDTIELEVYVPSNITQHPQNRLGVEEWTDVILSCTATGHPLPAISWEREGGEDLPVFSVTSFSKTNRMVVSTLTIGKVRYMDMGHYRCLADNTETAVAHSQYAELSITPSLRLTAAVNNHPRQITDLIFVEEGSSVRIECFGTGTLEWSSSSGLDIPSDSQNQKYQQPDYSRGVQTLYINDFSDSVTSTYTCTTDLTNDHLRKTVYITNSNPAVYIAEEIQFVQKDNSTFINATIFSHPAVDSIQWYHEGSPVDPSTDTRFSFSEDQSVLYIHNVDMSVLGTYEVVAANGNEIANDAVIIAIPDSPSGPMTTDSTAAYTAYEDPANQSPNQSTVKSNCSLSVDSSTSNECTATVTGTSFKFGVQLIILVPVAGILLIAIFVLLICILALRFCCLKKKPKTGHGKRDTENLAKLSRNHTNGIHPSPSASDGSIGSSNQSPSPYVYSTRTMAAANVTDPTRARYIVLKGSISSLSPLPPLLGREDRPVLPSSNPLNDSPNTNSRSQYGPDLSNRRQDDINPYATIPNSAIPYSSTTGFSSMRGRMPCGNSTPRILPVQAAQQAQIRLPRRYSQPIARSSTSLHTLSTAV